MLYELLNRLHRDVLLESEWLDDLTGFDQNVTLNHALVRVLCIPFFTHRHAHESVKLFGTGELVWQVFDPILLGKLLISFLCLIDLHAL